ncbi:hypothetical protein EII17_08945 [Clostridiales bacterium COT073_COT-073]|nr:hypothetical protein EII17_08945 [Clostridiales bacterium COT073_COT-073]
MQKRTFTGLLALLLGLIFVAIFAYHNSYRIALSRAGFSEDSITYVDTGIDDNGNEYRVVFQYENMIKFLRLTKDKYGIWKVTEVCVPNSKAQYIAMGWMRMAGIRRYDVKGESDIEFEMHMMYGGNTATKQIEIPAEILPSNVSVNVFQAETAYVLHFVTYGKPGTLNQIDIPHLLEQTGCIR